MKYAAFIATAALTLAATTAMAFPNTRNPDLDAANRLIDQSYNRIDAARRGARFDGHAQKAQALLRQAQAELSQADRAWNPHR